MDEQRQQGLEKMQEVYGWEVEDGPGDFFATTVDHLFADIWSRGGLSIRDRRLLLIGALTAQGLNDVADIQVQAALGNAEFDGEQLREIALFLTHYVGWPLGTKLNAVVENAVNKHSRSSS